MDKQKEEEQQYEQQQQQQQNIEILNEGYIQDQQQQQQLQPEQFELDDVLSGIIEDFCKEIEKEDKEAEKLKQIAQKQSIIAYKTIQNNVNIISKPHVGLGKFQKQMNFLKTN